MLPDSSEFYDEYVWLEQVLADAYAQIPERASYRHRSDGGRCDLFWNRRALSWWLLRYSGLVPISGPPRLDTLLSLNYIAQGSFPVKIIAIDSQDCLIWSNRSHDCKNAADWILLWRESVQLTYNLNWLHGERGELGTKLSRTFFSDPRKHCSPTAAMH